MAFSPKKVLYVFPNAELGGAEKITLQIINHHNRERFTPVVFFLNHGPLVKEFEMAGLPIYCLGHSLRLRKPWDVLRAMKMCYRIVTEEQVQLIHSVSAYSHLICAPVAGLKNIPVCLFQHGPVQGMQDRLAPVFKTDHIFTNSKFTAARQKKVGLVNRPLTVIPLGTDLLQRIETDTELNESFDVRHRLKSSDIIIALLARFDPLKGIDVALKALAPILRNKPDVFFLVVGAQYRNFHPDYCSEIEEIVRSENIGEKVIFTGFQKEVSALISRADIVLNASIRPEGFGLTILEGMALGKAVVGPRAGGIKEIIREGVDGMFHDPGDINGLRAVIERLVNDATLRRALGVEARKTVLEKFQMATMMNSLESNYDDILAKRMI